MKKLSKSLVQEGKNSRHYYLLIKCCPIWLIFSYFHVLNLWSKLAPPQRWRSAVPHVQHIIGKGAFYWNYTCLTLDRKGTVTGGVTTQLLCILVSRSAMLINNQCTCLIRPLVCSLCVRNPGDVLLVVRDTRELRVHTMIVCVPRLYL
jgi:hypothetical protein